MLKKARTESSAPASERANRLRSLLPSGQENLRSVEELDVGQLRGDADALKAALGAVAAFKREQILVDEVRGELMQIRREGNGGGGADIVGCGARDLCDRY